MAIKRSSQGGTPFGTTANRPANPAVGQTYYNGTLGYLEMYTAAGWAAAAKAIPFGNTAARPANPVIGEPYFNGQEARLELYTSNGWQNIVQETPSVVSIVGQLNESTTSTITINGTNFAAGAIASVVGTNGVETVANTTTLVSVVEITAVFPALSPSLAPYDVKVVNTSNLYGVLYETLGVNDNPVWSTSAGSLGTFTELDVVSVTVAATDATDSTNSPLQYTLVSGSLPTGFSLNSTTGVISGTAVNVATNTTYSFTIGASDSRNTVQTRAFSITINDRSPVWTTGTALPTFTKNVAYSTTVAATEDESGAITYSLVSGSLATGLTLSSAGVISGTPTSSINTSFTLRATVTASGNTADRAFTMANSGPSWVTTSITNAPFNSAYSFQLSASDDSGNSPTYSIASGSLPAGFSLSSSGLISGSSAASGTTSVTFRATDANSEFTDRALSFTVNSFSVEYLIIAGGGSGGNGVTNGSNCSGGGGAGGVLNGSTALSRGTGYGIVIGAGGAAYTASNSQAGYSGNNSTAFNLTAIAGGLGGGANGTPGGNGGSGGGAGEGAAAGSGTAGQGFEGGSNNFGGGGGAAGAGRSWNVHGTANGGIATTAYSTWASATGTGVGGAYAGGGGGGVGSSFTRGLGGGGGATDGGPMATGSSSATANTGSGSGAAGTQSGAGNTGGGGSGIVIVRYPGSQISTGGSVVSSGGYTYHTFTGSGTFTA